METTTPIDAVAEEARSARRTKALATIAKLRPLSIFGQQVELLFAYLMVLLVVFASLVRPSADLSPIVLIPLLAAVGAVAGNAMITQRRLEAVIELLKQDIKTS